MSGDIKNSKNQPKTTDKKNRTDSRVVCTPLTVTNVRRHSTATYGMVAHIKKRKSGTERRAFSHTRCPSWRHTGGHRTGYLRVQNQPYSFFNNF
jgi:hypothetical protein